MLMWKKRDFLINYVVLILNLDKKMSVLLKYFHWVYDPSYFQDSSAEICLYRLSYSDWQYVHKHMSWT
jgi:hypothetical protein